MSALAWPSATVAVRRLGAPDGARLRALAQGSGLPTLQAPERLAWLLADGVVLGGFVDSELVGCACLDLDVAKDHVDPSGRRVPLPLPNAYLCGAYVHARARGQGVGGRLYARRLELALALPGRAIVVELLGTGTPGSVHPDTRPGLRFHLRSGFSVLGHSIDDDGGAVLGRPPRSNPRRYR